MQAKSLLGLLDLDADMAGIVREVVRFAARNSVNYGEGLIRLGCVANLYPRLSRETAYQALLYAIRQVAADTANSVARRQREPLRSDDHDAETLRRWLRQWVRTRHRDAAERTLLTGVASNDADLLADLLYGAGSERLFANTGHVLDACNKGLEMIALLGDEEAFELVPLLVPALVGTRGEEESTTWHHPIDIVTPLREIEERLAGTLEANAAGGDRPLDGDALTGVLLGDDPLAILDALETGLRDGAPAEELARRVAHAASLRLARFATSNEVTDWFSPQHTLNFANAVHQAVSRIATPDTVRGIFQAAIAVYVDRYLNVPAARMPGADLDDLPDDPAGLRSALLGLLDQRAEIDAAARIVSRWIRLGHPQDDLIDTLAFAAVREDIDFHCLQVVEASARQCAAWSASPDARQRVEEILVGAVRNLAAHCPTRRAGQQTANIALRLHRGDHVFEEEGAEAR